KKHTNSLRGKEEMCPVHLTAVQSSPLSPGKPSIPLMPGGPVTPGKPFNPAAPGAPGRPFGPLSPLGAPLPLYPTL
uniref:Uncharacterized protein n=1 Tax=Athene cunicularia TaxID=194338 RepID=A0A663N1V9_ATHCN